MSPMSPMSPMSQGSSHDVSSLPFDQLRRFSTSLQELSSARDVDATLQLMVDLATELVVEVDFADVMFVRSGTVTTPVASHETAIKVDQLQHDTGEGPCLSVLKGEATMVVVDDLEHESRWPEFTPRALQLGIRSASAHRLFRTRDGGEDLFGALNLFGAQPGIDPLGVELRRLLAAHCSAALAGAIEDEGLQAALASRDVIGQAKGILMERHRITADEAYAMLREASMEHNTKVRDLAETVTTTGSLP